jgi:hypothetical protein
MRDAMEQVGRPPGDHLVITRQELDDVIDGIGFVSRRVCDLAGGV